MRRVTRLNPGAETQGVLLPGYRYHAVFTDSTFALVDAEAAHQDHTIIEAVFADLEHRPLAHAPTHEYAWAGVRLSLGRRGSRWKGTAGSWWFTESSSDEPGSRESQTRPRQ